MGVKETHKDFPCHPTKFGYLRKKQRGDPFSLAKHVQGGRSSCFIPVNGGEDQEAKGCLLRTAGCLRAPGRDNSENRDPTSRIE